jgi:hypothetical protein
VTRRCFSCDIELSGEPLMAAGRTYCCSGCAGGGPCSCTYEVRSVIPTTNGHTDPVLTRELLGLLFEDRSDDRGRPNK